MLLLLQKRQKNNWKNIEMIKKKNNKKRRVETSFQKFTLFQAFVYFWACATLSFLYLFFSTHCGNLIVNLNHLPGQLAA